MNVAVYPSLRRAFSEIRVWFLRLVFAGFNVVSFYNVPPCKHPMFSMLNASYLRLIPAVGPGGARGKRIYATSEYGSTIPRTECVNLVIWPDLYHAFS
jgi:glucan biosynthesis protein